jgi:NAD-dependent deacetylase
MDKPLDRHLTGIKFAADIIQESRRAVALTGAGISTRSGIPDFRSPTSGLWDEYDPFEVASLTAFRHDPKRFYHWMKTLTQMIICAEPNSAHFGLAQLQRMGFIQTIITQNVDMLHQKSGSDNVLEVHGSFAFMCCTECFQRQAAEAHIRSFLETEVMPRCEFCGGILKPNVVLMGEQLPAQIWKKAIRACKECDLMIVIGSSLEVLPVAGLPMRALEKKARLILINYSETYLDERADIVLHGDAAQILPGIVTEIELSLRKN